jgi:C-terminal processing protease CtpA/Prc
MSSPRGDVRIGLAAPRRLAVAATAAVAVAFALSADVHAGDLSIEARRADFAELVTIVADQYAYLDGRRAAWSTVKERYAERVDRATTADAWSAVLEDALAELRDFHTGVQPGSARAWLPVPTAADLWAVPEGEGARVVAVRSGTDAARAGIAVGDRIDAIDGTPVATAIAARLGGAADARDDDARAWAVLSLVTGRRGEPRTLALRTDGGATRTVTLPALRRVDRPTQPVAWSRLDDGVGYVRFNNSLGEQKTVAAFDAALADLRDTRGLILDLRDVPSGGNSGVALGILGRFADRRGPYQRHRIAHYGQADVERNWVEEVAPRGPFTYGAPVVALVGHWTGSMGEGMAIGLDAMRRATVVGTTMGRLQGANEGFDLARTGERVSFPTEQLFHVDGTPRHRWTPPVVLPPGPSADDDALAEARRRLTETPAAR